MNEESSSYVHPLFAAWLSGVSELLLSARDARRSYGFGQVYPDSQFMKETSYIESNYKTKYPCDIVYLLGQTWTVVVADLMAGVGALCEMREITFSGLPLVRMAEEYAARVAWLLGDEPTVEQRAARALLEDANGSSEMALAATHTVGKSHPTRAFYRARLKSTKLVTKSMFPDSIIENEPKDWIVIGKTVFDESRGPEPFEERFARPTETANRFGERWVQSKDWEGFYHYLSACVHPGTGVQEFFELRDRESARTETDFESFERQLRVAIISHYECMNHFVSFFGFETSRVDQMCNEIELYFPGLIRQEESG